MRFRPCQRMSLNSIQSIAKGISPPVQCARIEGMHATKVYFPTLN